MALKISPVKLFIQLAHRNFHKDFTFLPLLQATAANQLNYEFSLLDKQGEVSLTPQTRLLYL